jgi:hypothetical protein
VAGQLGARCVVDVDAGGSDVFGEMAAGARAGDEQDVGREVQQRGEGDLGICG